MEETKNVVLPVMLTGNNYFLWSRTTKTTLRSKGLWEHILTAEWDGEEVEEESDSGKKKSGRKKTGEELWEQEDQLVLSVLQNSLEPSILAAYSYSETAKGLWDTLKSVFGNLSNLSRIYEVKKALNDLQQEGKTFKALFGEYRALWAELDMLRPATSDLKELQERKEQDQVFGLLLTLDESYKDLIKHLLRYEKLPNLNEVCLAIIKEEGSKSLLKGPSETVHYGQGPHGQGRGNDGRGYHGEKKDLYCVHCKTKGHTKEKCWTLYPHLSPSWFKSGSSGQKKVANMAREEDGFVRKSDLEALVKSISELTKGKSFFAKTPKPIVVDSGASHNMVSDVSLLKNLRPHGGKVCVANGENVNIEGIGDLHVLDGKTKALFMPKFTNNLLSVFKATSDLDCKVVFDSNGVEFVDRKSGLVIGEGKVKDGLYTVGKSSVEAALVSKFSPSRWHERFGHPQFKTLQLMVPNLTKEVEGCEACILGKHSRSSFPDSCSSYESCFDLVHTDVWSSPCSTRDQYKYFISFIDEKSKYTWVTLMSSKSQAFDCFVRFHSYVSTQYGAKIKTLRSDNGGEYVNHQMKGFLEKHGIVHQTSCPYTPQQNGVAERKNRHLMEMTRTILFAKGVPKVFWGDAVMTSTYLINRLPTPNLNNMSPYEILNGEKPKMDHLRVFGCVCYVHTPEGTRNKLEARSVKCVFLGYSSTQKGWKCYNPETRRMYVSRDVKFDEGSSYFNEKDWSKGEKLVQSSEDQAKKLRVILAGLKNIVGTDSTQERGEIPVESQVTREEENVSHEEEEEIQKEDDQNEEESSRESVVHQEEECSQEGEGVSQEVSQPVLRRSTRIKYGPDHWKSTRVYYNNFVCKGETSTSVERCTNCSKSIIYPPKVESKCSYPIDDYYTLEYLPKMHQCYLVELDNEEIPDCFEVAKSDSRWAKAMDEELDSMRKNDTWEIVERPKDKKCVGNRWVYTIKRLSDGAIERYKARLVAKGYTQVYGEDYTDTFAPVAKLHTVRVLLAVAINKSWGLWQMDVKNAFLQGELEEEVYMDIPEGVLVKGKDQVCKLKKAIYGLKQSPRAWYQRLSSCLMDKGFAMSSADHSLFMRHGKEGMVIVLIYVDDIIITGDDVEGIERTKRMLKEEFEIKDLGELKYFLGIEILRMHEGMSICQRKYTLEILGETGKLGTRPAKTPIEDNYKEDVEKEPWPDVKQYQRLVGKLIYLTITRPDISFAVNQVSKHMQAPTLHHWHMVERILRYLKMNPGKGIWFNNNQRTDLVGYCDADWAGDRVDRKSTTGYCTFVGGNLVTWKSKKQKVVSLSSAEAEYRAMKEVTKELIWLRELLKDLGVRSDQPTTLYCDNKAALHIASNPVFHERTKHIEVDCHFVREKVQDGTIQTAFVRSDEQYADIFTKATTSQVCDHIHGKIGLRDLHQPILRRSVKSTNVQVEPKEELLNKGLNKGMLSCLVTQAIDFRDGVKGQKSKGELIEDKRSELRRSELRSGGTKKVEDGDFSGGTKKANWREKASNQGATNQGKLKAPKQGNLE